MVLEEKIRDALKEVFDPELNQNIVDLGLIYEIKDDNGKVLVRMTFTTPACPAGPMILSGARNKALGVEGVKDVKIELTFKPPWTPQMASEEIQALFEELT